MAQPSNERRFQRFRMILEAPPPCPVCKSPRFTRVGLVDDVGIFWCADCDGVFSIPPAAQAPDTDHGPPEEP
jgi:hypothetical protein